MTDTVTLLEEVAFDLVITDSFSRVPRDAFIHTVALPAAGATPVALFSARSRQLAPAQAAGFRDLIAKPFDVDVLVRQVRTLLGVNDRRKVLRIDRENSPELAND